MRARTVNENVNFERGKDPKSKMDIGVKDMTGYVKMELEKKFPKEDPDELESRFWDIFFQGFQDDRGPKVAERFLTWMENSLPLEYQKNYIQDELDEISGYIDDEIEEETF